MSEIRTIPPKLTDTEWNALLDHALEKSSSYIVRLNGSDYEAVNGSTGKIDSTDADKDTVVQAAIDALTSGGVIVLKEFELGSVTYGNTILILEYYQGRVKIYSNQGKSISAAFLSSDPSTAGWGNDQKGYHWFNETEGKYKYWNGASIVAYPVTGGAGAPTDASYVTINAEADLDAEVQHGSITDEAQKHIPKLHASRHENTGADEIDVAGLSGELADNQPPKTHASAHQSGGGDAIKLDNLATPDDNTDLNVSITAHGLTPKLSNVLTQFLNGQGGWTAPVGTTTSLGSYSYIIYKSGVDWYAEDGEGNIIYGGSGDAGSVNGADPSAVIQACHDALTNGGLVFLKNSCGVMTGDSPFLSVTNDNFRLVAESSYVTIKREDNDSNYNSDYFIRIKAESILFKNLTIDGNQANNTRYRSTVGGDPWRYGDNLFVGVGAKNITLLNVTFKNALKYGVQVNRWDTGNNPINIYVTQCNFIDNCWNGILWDKTTNSIMDKCYVEGSSDVGISIHNCQGLLINYCIVIDIDGTLGYTDDGLGAYGTRWGISVEETASGNVEVAINNCVVKGCHQGIRIYGDYVRKALITDCIVYGNNLPDADGGENWSVGIYAASSNGKAEIRNSIVQNNLYSTACYNFLIADPDCSIIGCFIDQSGATTENAKNIVLSAGGDRTLIENNIISNAILGSSGIGISSDNNVILNNKITDNSVGITINAGADNNIVKMNYFSGNTTTLTNSGASNVIKYNEGYATENRGITTIGNGTDTTGNVAHGLAGTPTVVFAHGSETETVHLYCDSKDGTNIVIKCLGVTTGDRTIYWHAEYTP